jgi:hypothetical protein
MSNVSPPARCSCDHPKHRDNPCRNMVDDPQRGLICKECLEQCKSLKKGGEIVATQEKKKTRGAKKVRKAGKKQRRQKISKSGKSKA